MFLTLSSFAHQSEAKASGETKMKKTKVQRYPTVETRMFVSQDKRWLITKTLTTDIKAIGYLDKVLATAKQTAPEGAVIKSSGKAFRHTGA